MGISGLALSEVVVEKLGMTMGISETIEQDQRCAEGRSDAGVTITESPVGSS